MTLRRREMLDMQRTDTVGDAGCSSKEAELIWSRENASAAWKKVLLLRSPQGWQGVESSVVPDGGAVIQEGCKGTAKMPMQRKGQEQDRGAICNTQCERTGYPRKKRLSRDFQLLF